MVVVMMHDDDGDDDDDDDDDDAKNPQANPNPEPHHTYPRRGKHPKHWEGGGGCRTGIIDDRQSLLFGDRTCPVAASPASPRNGRRSTAAVRTDPELYRMGTPPKLVARLQ